MVTKTSEHIDAPQMTIQQFVGVLGRQREVARPERYIVQIIKPQLTMSLDLNRDLAYLCEGASLPGRNFMTADVRYYGPAFKMPVMSEYQPLELTFVVRDFMQEKMFFDEWQNLINPKTSYDFSYRDDYSTTINIYQYSVVGTGNESSPMEATYKATLVKAWPVFVQPLPLTYSELNGYHKLSVTFAFSDWRNNVEVTQKIKNFNIATPIIAQTTLPKL